MSIVINLLLFISVLLSFISTFSVATAGSTNTQPMIHGHWVHSDKLMPGMKILTADNQVLVVKENWVQRKQNATTYNFEVAKSHSYFVSKHKLWAHNICIEDINANYPDAFVSVRYGTIEVRLGANMTDDAISQLRYDIAKLRGTTEGVKGLPVKVVGDPKNVGIYNSSDIPVKEQALGIISDRTLLKEHAEVTKRIEEKANAAAIKRIGDNVYRKLFGKKKPD